MKTSSASNALLQYEAGQELHAMDAMVDSGDHKTFSTEAASLWSNRDLYTPKIYPDGLETGGEVTPGALENKVSVAALTCYLAGVKTSVGADGAVALTRPGGGSPNCINSITIDDGGNIVVIKGTDGSALSATRDAAGGPPLIPAGSIEIGQVKLTSAASAMIESAEIFRVPGTSLEKYDYPVWDEDPFTGTIIFASALPAIHEGSPEGIKGVYAEIYEPVFANLEPAVDFKPPANTHSVGSTQVYGGTVGSSSSSLGGGSFKTFLKDGITDPLALLADEIITFKFFPDRNKVAYLITQGKLGVDINYPAADNINAACTIAATEKAKKYSS
jgi:hypothetical protein